MLNPLTSFRFFAAFLVFIWHSGIGYNHLFKYEFGYVGVSFFFVLSGFILTYNYFKKFSELRSDNLRSFYVARVAKIYPVHFLTFLIAIPVILMLSQMGNGSIQWGLLVRKALLNIPLLQCYYPNMGYGFSFNGVSWSLCDEMFFYILMPFILYALNRFRDHLSKVHLLILAIAFWASDLLIALPHHVGLDDWLFYVFPPMRGFDFLIGALIGMVFLKGQAVAKTSTWTVLESLSIMLLCAAMWYSPHVPQVLRFGIYLMPFWAFLIYVFAHQGGLISELMSARILVYAGNISFSFYMIHQLVISYVTIMQDKGVQIPHYHILELVVAVGLSSLIYHTVEEPARKRIRRLFDKSDARRNQRLKTSVEVMQ